MKTDQKYAQVRIVYKKDDSLGNSSFLWDIGKKKSPRCDTAVAASDLGLFCLLKGISSKNEIKMKITPDVPKNENGLTQMIRKGKSIRH